MWWSGLPSYSLPLVVAFQSALHTKPLARGSYPHSVDRLIFSIVNWSGFPVKSAVQVRMVSGEREHLRSPFDSALPRAVWISDSGAFLKVQAQSQISSGQWHI